MSGGAQLSLVPTEDIGDTRQAWATPRPLFESLHARFRFTVDACAVAWNAKLPLYWSPQDNGLLMPWGGERVWCNPPYDDIAPWVALGPDAELAVYLLPARVDQQWFHRALRQGARVEFVEGRVAFTPPPGVAESSNREPSILLIFGGGQ